MPRPSLKTVLTRLDDAVELLHQDYGGLPRAVEADQILREIWVEDTYHSTGIEGNPLSRRQVERLLEEGQASGRLTDTLEVEGYARAARWVYAHAQDYPASGGLPLSVVQEVQRQLVAPHWTVNPPEDGSTPGSFRRRGVNIAGSSVKTTPPIAIDGCMQDWLDHTGPVAGDTGEHELEHVAGLHAWFERIHPFVDGNGRAGRLLLNFSLMQRGYPPAVLLQTERRRYLAALARADDGNSGYLTELIARAIESNIHRFLIPGLAGDARLIPLQALAEGSGYTHAYLRTLVVQGRLRASRQGRIWMSSRGWLQDYKASRKRPGRPRSSHRS
ncbi:Fic family protein [soil metagenome]